MKPFPGKIQQRLADDIPASRFRRLCEIALAVPEAILSPRGLSLLFLIVAALLAFAGWLRPPLSPDISGLHLPIGLLGHSWEEEGLLYESRRIPVDSVGFIILLPLVVAVFAVLREPKFLGPFAGLLLALAITANAGVAFNHPVLIEILEHERAQGAAMAEFLRVSPISKPVVRIENARVVPAGISKSNHDPWGEFLSGLDYLLYGPWLVAWSILGILFSSRGYPAFRLRRVGLWTLAGLAGAVAICTPRIQAERLWAEAYQLELRGRWEDSRSTLEKSRSHFPEFSRLERTWLLAGKLDYHLGRDSAEELFSRAVQIGRNHPIEAVPLLEALVERGETAAPPVARRAAQLYTRSGLNLYSQRAAFTDSGPDNAQQERLMTAAKSLWQRASEIDPSRLDSRFFVIVLRAYLDGNDPEAAQRSLEPMLERTADAFLRAEMLGFLGDVHFLAGRMTEARFWYARSLDELNLPQRKNLRAQKGLGGL